MPAPTTHQATPNSKATPHSTAAPHKTTPHKTAPTTRKPAPVKTTAPAPMQGVHPGAFCAKAKAGTYGYTVTGVRMRCERSATDTRYRWRAA
jgi:hypothetical protein